jgi:hypothetical protein
MDELGRPDHAFSATKIEGVRRARIGPSTAGTRLPC